jgi:hypothetical protein
VSVLDGMIMLLSIGITVQKGGIRMIDERIAQNASACSNDVRNEPHRSSSRCRSPPHDVDVTPSRVTSAHAKTGYSWMESSRAILRGFLKEMPGTGHDGGTRLEY